MPLYEFECPVCKAVVAELYTYAEAEKGKSPVCPICDEYMNRLIGRAMLDFHGTGFQTRTSNTAMMPDGHWPKNEEERKKARSMGMAI